MISAGQPADAPRLAAAATAGTATVTLRHDAVDDSTFLDDGDIIKGVAGRLL